MMRLFQILAVIAIGLATSAKPQQQASPDRMTVAFSDSSRPGLLQVSITNGDVTIRGNKNGKEVVIVSRSSAKSRSLPTPSEAAGLRRLELGPSGVTAQEANNVINVRTHQMMMSAVLEIEVPTKTNLQVSATLGGKLLVENVEGDIELSNVAGDVTAVNVAGSVVAHSMSGNVIVSFRQVAPQNAMSFVSWSGKIDVTFPDNTKANLEMVTNNGDIYSDFDIQLRPSRHFVGEEMGGKSASGTINGGGPDYEFRTFSGNIYLRKERK